MERLDQLLKKFLNEGLEAFEPDEVLELLLEYVVSEPVAKAKAKKLLQQLGSVTSVMDMRLEGLIRIAELGEKSATLLNLIPKIIRRYYIDNLDVSNLEFDDIENLGAYCTAKYIGTTDEVLSIIMIDDKAHFIGFEVIQVGSFSAASINLEKIAEILFAYDAPYFVLVHNHPDARISPSDADVNSTYYVKQYFESFEKELLEHIIVYNNRYMPIIMYLIEEEKEFENDPDFASFKAVDDKYKFKHIMGERRVKKTRI